MKQKAVCVCNDSGYEGKITKGKVYEVEQVEGIFPNRPLYVFIDDNGKEAASHLYRFEIIKEGLT